MPNLWLIRFRAWAHGALDDSGCQAPRLRSWQVWNGGGSRRRRAETRVRDMRGGVSIRWRVHTLASLGKCRLTSAPTCPPRTGRAGLQEPAEGCRTAAGGSTDSSLASAPTWCWGSLGPLPIRVAERRTGLTWRRIATDLAPHPRDDSQLPVGDRPSRLAVAPGAGIGGMVVQRVFFSHTGTLAGLAGLRSNTGVLRTSLLGKTSWAGSCHG